jgi:membrane associated rhomboid family serine protease
MALPLILALILLALAVPLVVHGVAAHRRALHADRRGILADGATATGTVAAIAPDAAGRCRVTIEFAAQGRDRPLRFTQPAPVAAVAALGLVPGAPLEVRHRRTRAGIAFAPALLLAGYAPKPALAPAGGAGPVLYLVSFEDPRGAGMLQRPNAFGWSGGELLVDAAALEIRAIRTRPFRRPVPAGRRVALGAVQNVEALANRVSLELDVDGTPLRLQFWTVDDAAAAELVRRLPATRTAAFVPMAAEEADFLRRLIAAAPATPVTTGLVALNLAVFVAAALLGAGWLKADAARLVMLGSNYTPLTLGGQPWRLVTGAFLHFGPWHVGFNMWALLANGPFAERLYGSTRYLLVYLVAAVGASLASLWWYPLVNGAGASGAIFGVFGATLAFFVRAPAGVPAAVARRYGNRILLFIALALVLGLGVQFIDHAAHLGGLVVGFAAGYGLARPPGSPRTSPARERQHALGLAVAVAAVVAIAVLGGPTTEAVSATIRGGVPGVVPHPTVAALAGIRLGETRAELEAGRGRPLRERPGTWYYDAGEPGQPAVLEVTFHQSGGHPAAGDPVGAVFYGGDKAHAPPELLYVIGLARAQLVADFGQPVWVLRARDGIDYEMYADGLTVEFEHDRARAYGVQDYYRKVRD